jgi:hypothetical protein
MPIQGKALYLTLTSSGMRAGDIANRLKDYVSAYKNMPSDINRIT